MFQLAIGNLVNGEPLYGGVQETGHDLLNVMDVIDLIGLGIVDVDGQHFPIGFSFVNEGHGAQDLDLNNGPPLVNSAADLANINRISVALASGAVVGVLGILPGLGQSTIVPNVALRKVETILSTVTDFK